MISTVVGYSGGSTKNPTYRNIMDHTESIRIEYDPEVLTFEDMLKEFFFGHDPVRPAYSKQYASIIFYNDQEQKDLAEKMLRQEEERRGTKLFTAIRPASEFYIAEDYHQKYYLRGNSILYRDIKNNYQDQADFIRSTSAARINGYLGGFDPLAVDQAKLDQLGLSDQGREVLSSILDQQEKRFSCSF